ncbi:MAG: DUF5674 family protein [Candidatus Krumholzibacteriales bacterium]
MQIIRDRISFEQLGEIAESGFGSFVKAVVDVNTGVMAIDAEVHRATSRKRKGNGEYSRMALYRALELIDLTAAANRDSCPGSKEILRVREMLADFLDGDNRYNSTERQWEKCFHGFTCLARRDR